LAKRVIIMWESFINKLLAVSFSLIFVLISYKEAKKYYHSPINAIIAVLLILIIPSTIIATLWNLKLVKNENILPPAYAILAAIGVMISEKLFAKIQK